MDKKYYGPLIPDSFFHVYNRGNNFENVFFSQENYAYFLRRYQFFMIDILDTYAYCLLPNHFHLLIRVKDAATIYNSLEYLPSLDEEKIAKWKRKFDVSKFISEQFRRLMVSYSMSINVQEERSGSLFLKNFKRIRIESQRHLRRVLICIHNNPVHHGFVKHPGDYLWSSYGRILMPAPSALRKAEVLQLFDGADEFKKAHERGKGGIITDLYEMEK